MAEQGHETKAREKGMKMIDTDAHPAQSKQETDKYKRPRGLQPKTSSVKPTTALALALCQDDNTEKLIRIENRPHFILRSRLLDAYNRSVFLRAIFSLQVLAPFLCAVYQKQLHHGRLIVRTKKINVLAQHKNHIY